jgi:hypothetical protein
MKYDKLIYYNLKEIFLKSVKQSFKTSWMLIKIYIPISLGTIFLKQLGFIDFITPIFAPIMKLMGLPGEAAITLVAGSTNTIYAALATITAFDLTFRQVTILGIVVGLAHNLFVETAILSKLKMANFKIAFFRISIAILTGILMNFVLPDNINGTILTLYTKTPEFSWVLVFKGLLVTSIQIIVILFFITLGYELLILWKYSSLIKQKIKFLPNTIGFSDNAFGPWIVGFFIGIAYGAGMLFNFAEKKNLTHKDVCLVTIFLCLAHAIIEDTMIFVVVGGNFWWIILTRIFMSFFVVKILSLNNFYKKFLWIGLPKER